MRLVIGDIHGNRKALDLVLDFYDAVQQYSKIKNKLAVGKRVSKVDLEIMQDLHTFLESSESITELVVLGDIVNRGDDSAYCIDKLIEKDKEGLIKVSIRGNHEDMVLDAYDLVGQHVENLEGILKASIGISKDLAGALVDTVGQLFEGVPKKRLEEMDASLSQLYNTLKSQGSLRKIVANHPDGERILADMESHERSFWFYDIVSKINSKFSKKEFRAFRRYAFMMKQKDCVDEEVKYEDKTVKVRWSHGAPLHNVEGEENPNRIYVYPADFKKEGRRKCEDYALQLYREGINQVWLAHTHVQGHADVKIGVWNGEPHLYNNELRKEMKRQGKNFDSMHHVEFYKPGSVGNARDVPDKISFALIFEDTGRVKTIRAKYDSRSIKNWTLD